MATLLASLAAASTTPLLMDQCDLPTPAASGGWRSLSALPSQPPARSLRVFPTTQVPTFEKLWSRGSAALLCGDYAQAARSFSAANRLRPNEPRVLANLQRLACIGFAAEGIAKGPGNDVRRELTHSRNSP